MINANTVGLNHVANPKNTGADNLCFSLGRLAFETAALGGIALAVATYTEAQRGPVLTTYIEAYHEAEANLNAIARALGLRVKANPNRVSMGRACDSRCTNAKGHTCVCSCGGTNHGMEYAAVQAHATAFRAMPISQHIAEMTPLLTPTVRERVLVSVDPSKHIFPPVAPPTRTYAPTPANPFDADGGQETTDGERWEEQYAEEAAFDRAAAAIRHEDHLARTAAVNATFATVPYEKTANGARTLAWARR